MKKVDKSALQKVTLSVNIGGKKQPVKKEALVCAKSGQIVRFIDKTRL